MMEVRTPRQNAPSVASSRTCLALVAVLAGVPAALAQSSPQQAASLSSEASVRPALLAAARPLSLAELAGVTYSHDDEEPSSSSVAENAGLTFSPETAAVLQPPPRRRYGRPRYNDSMHNADGSNKLAVMLGGGLTVPVGNVTTKYLKLSYKFQGGVGINFNKNASVLLQVDYDHFALPGSLIASEIAVYNAAGFYYLNNQNQQVAVDFSQLDGSAHIWSVTLNPTFNFYQGDVYGMYAVVGGGLYHKITQFTLPQSGVAYDYNGYPYQFVANSAFPTSTYTSNSAGVNGGIGFTFKPSRFAGERFFAEARYVHTFNTPSGRTQAQYNFYPGNGSTSDYIPVSVGVRF